MSVEFKSIADRYPRVRRLAVLILVGGGLAAYSLLKPYMPHDHPVAYRFAPDARSVTDLEATWTRADSTQDEPVAGARFHFDPGAAPRELRATVRGPDGDYSVDVVVTAASARNTVQQRVTLGDRITRIDVPVPSPSSSAP
jgi:hypothetical protein